MPANIKNCIEFSCPWYNVGQRERLFPQLTLCVEKRHACFVPEGLDRVRINRSFATLGRHNDDFGLVFEDIIRVGEFRLVM